MVRIRGYGPAMLYVCIYVWENVPEDGSLKRHLHYSQHPQVRVLASPGNILTQMAK